MRLRALKHLLDAKRALAQPERIIILGSSSLLPQHPELGEAGHPLEGSYDSDLLIAPMEEDLAAILGEVSAELGKHPAVLAASRQPAYLVRLRTRLVRPIHSE